MEFDTYLKDYVFHVTPFIPSSDIADFSVLHLLSTSYREKLSSFLFFPVDRTEVTRVLYVAFNFDLRYKFKIYLDQCLLAMFDSYRDKESSLNGVKQQVVVYSATANQNYSNLHKSKRLLRKIF